MRITDMHRTVSIEMKVWNEESTSYSPDWSNDFFESGSLSHTEDGDGEIYIVKDVDYCIDQAREWENEDENNCVFVEDIQTTLLRKEGEVMTANEIFQNTRSDEDADAFYFENGILFHDLDEMLFDYWDEASWSFHHPTGREFYIEKWGQWCTEYEGINDDHAVEAKCTVEVGDEYEDPDGRWLVEEIRNGQVSIRNINVGGLNEGQSCEVSLEEAEYWKTHDLNGNEVC